MNTNKLLFIGLLLLISLVTPKSQLYSIKITNYQRPLFQNLVEKLNIDVWRDNIPINSNFDILINEDLSTELEKSLKNLKIPFFFNEKFNLEKLIEREKENLKTSIDDFFLKFHTYSEIQAWLENMVKSYPDISQKISIGKSFEDRDLFGIKITKKNNFVKSRVLISSGMHAREWAGISTSCWIISELLNKSATSTSFLLETIEWIILPISNPDGFVYTHTTDRLWRKSRSLNSGSTCIGTDPNRNWDFKWDSGSSSSNPCSETYRGPKANSEIELRSIINYISSLSNLKIYLDIHAYSQFLMRPFGWSQIDSQDEIAMGILNNRMTTNISQTYSKFYQPGKISVVIYETSGAGVDWIYSNKNAFSFAAEVRPSTSEEGGFLLPADQIIPTGEEMMNGVIEMGKSIINKTEIPKPIPTPIQSIIPQFSNYSKNATNSTMANVSVNRSLNLLLIFFSILINFIF
jgi:hypothetical protein